MSLFKAATLSAAMLAATAIAADAQETASAPPTNPPQVTTNPGFGYSPTPALGPGIRYSTGIPSNSSAGASPSTSAPANPSSGGASASAGIRSAQGSFYSKSGFGPAPN